MAAQVEADDAPPRHFERLGDAAPDGARLPRAVDEQHRGVVFGADCFGFEPHAGEAAKGQDAHAAPPSHSSNWRERRVIISRATSRSPSIHAVHRLRCTPRVPSRRPPSAARALPLSPGPNTYTPSTTPSHTDFPL